MKTDALENLRRYWEKLRKGRIAPYRAELDPRAFEDALENMFILEQLNPSQIRVRLAGMTLCEMMGMEVRGMPPEAIMAAPHRSGFSEHLHSVLNDPAIVELDLVTSGLDGRDVDARMLLLPLRSDFGEVTRVLGCVVTSTPEVRVPVNFSIVGQRTERVVADGAPAAGSAMAALPGFGEAPAHFARGDGTGLDGPALRSVSDNPEVQPTARRRGHLKVVRGE